MAEIEIGCLMCHGLPERIDTFEEMERLTKAWEKDRNERAPTVEWRFGVSDAREKLIHLHPTIAQEI